MRVAQNRRRTRPTSKSVGPRHDAHKTSRARGFGCCLLVAATQQRRRWLLQNNLRCNRGGVCVADRPTDRSRRIAAVAVTTTTTHRTRLVSLLSAHTHSHTHMYARRRRRRGHTSARQAGRQANKTVNHYSAYIIHMFYCGVCIRDTRARACPCSQ